MWEHAAELVLQRLAAQHAARTHGSPAPPRVALGSVDCTQRDSAPLCKRAHVQAFPTVRVYRGGAQSTPFDDDAHSHHESYTGPRVAEAVADFAMTVAQEVLTKTGQVSGKDVSPGAYTLGWQARRMRQQQAASLLCCSSRTADIARMLSHATPSCSRPARTATRTA